MKVAIIEDEVLAVERFKKVLNEVVDVDIENVLDSVESSVEYLKTNPQLDLLFMDIQLGDGRSFEILDQVEVKCPIIFTTAFDEYAVRAFKYNSIDYLLKPVRKEELHSAIEKFKKGNKLGNVRDIKELLLEMFHSSGNYKDRFLVKQGTKYLSINASEVAHIFTRERLLFLKTFDNKDYMIDGNLDELEKDLNPEKFFRANRQFIVSHRSVHQAFAWFDGKMKLSLIPDSYEDIVISRLKAGEFKKWLGK